MDNGKDGSKKPGDDFDLEPRRPNIWGPFYLVLGIGGLLFSIFSLWHHIAGIVPLYGTIMTSVLIGAISLLMLVYGYRVMKRDI